MAGTKRKHGGVSAGDVSNNKARSRPNVEARVDPTYGQRSALPGLDDEHQTTGDEDDLDYEEDAEALSYLRAVRQEAIGIPNLLVAPNRDISGRGIYENGVGDYRGSYGDGAYYAAPSNSEASEEHDSNVTYFDSIMTRYEALCDQLQNHQPPPEALARLDADHPTHVGPLDTAIARWWRWKMRHVDPLPAQICSMDKITVLRLLGLLSSGTLLKRGSQVEVSVSRWAWSLLARLPERGELTSEEIGVVRELGKKAVLLGIGLKEDATLNEGMDEVDPECDEEEEIPDIVNEEAIDVDGDFDEGLGISNEEDDTDALLPLSTTARSEDSKHPSAPTFSMPPSQALETDMTLDSDLSQSISLPESKLEADSTEDLDAAKARLLGNLTSNEVEESMITQDEEKTKIRPSKWNTRATVDMIVTVAGEAYGQRDLLEFRSMWDQIS